VITSKDHQATGKIKNTNFQRVKKVEINGYEEFFAEFPGMKVESKEIYIDSLQTGLH